MNALGPKSDIARTTFLTVMRNVIRQVGWRSLATDVADSNEVLKEALLTRNWTGGPWTISRLDKNAASPACVGESPMK
jgi:hypothetical protein